MALKALVEDDDCIVHYEDSKDMVLWKHPRGGRERLRSQSGDLLPLPSFLGVDSYLYWSGLCIPPHKRGQGMATRLIARSVIELGNTRHLLAMYADPQLARVAERYGAVQIAGRGGIKLYFRKAGPVETG